MAGTGLRANGVVNPTKAGTAAFGGVAAQNYRPPVPQQTAPKPAPAPAARPAPAAQTNPQSNYYNDQRPPQQQQQYFQPQQAQWQPPQPPPMPTDPGPSMPPLPMPQMNQQAQDPGEGWDVSGAGEVAPGLGQRRPPSSMSALASEARLY